MVLYCMVFHCIAWYCILSHGIAWYYQMSPLLPTYHLIFQILHIKPYISIHPHSGQQGKTTRQKEPELKHLFPANMFLILLLTDWLSDWLYPLPECSLASPGSPCSNLEADDCNYKAVGDHCCCGQCGGWFSLACVLDSTTGAGLWQPIDLMLCPAEGCGSEGEWWR